MKKRIYLFIPFLFVISLTVSVILYAHATGMTGVTRKTGGTGCSCHGSLVQSVIVSITGPDSVSPGQTVSYTVSITGGPLVRGGTDIAAQNGTLNVISGQGLQKIGSELTHTSPKVPSGGNVSFQFSYTAPNSLGKDTVYATGNSVNFNGNNSGDQWNHAPNKIVVIRNPVGIISSSTAEKFQLQQNYPNPFNPSTKIRFEIPAQNTNNGFVKLSVYDILGNESAVLVNEKLSPGSYEMEFDASALPSGVYFYTLNFADFTETKKMIYVK